MGVTAGCGKEGRAWMVWSLVHDCITRQRVSARSLEVWASRMLRAGEEGIGRD